jgi:hypothetical protein
MRFQLQRSDDLPALDPAIDGMMNMMGGFF